MRYLSEYTDLLSYPAPKSAELPKDLIDFLIQGWRLSRSGSRSCRGRCRRASRGCLCLRWRRGAVSEVVEVECVHGWVRLHRSCGREKEEGARDMC